MNVYQEVADYLEREPKARERSNKNRAIANILGTKYKLFSMIPTVSKEKLTDFAGDVLTYDRAWRKVLEERPDLRGSDYKEKKELEVEKQRELGYIV